MLTQASLGGLPIWVRDYAQFLAIQEEILLRVMQLVSQAGTGFAIPLQAPPSQRDTGVRL